ncbi:MAG TPA: hypothetical protein VF861_15255 [Telluria sp.]
MRFFSRDLALMLLAGCAAAAPLRDPFRRPAAPAPEPAAAAAAEVAPVLRAIMFAPRRSLTNIGGQILAVGEWYGDYKVVAIEERSVTLLRNKVNSVLVLDKEGSK